MPASGSDAAAHRFDAAAGHLGLTPTGARSLCWVRQPLRPDEVFGAAFTLGFDDRCAGRELPRRLRSPLHGAWLPVASVRSLRTGQAQTALHGVNATHTFLDGELAGVLRLVDRPSRLFLLTAGHVLGAARDAAAGDLVRFSFVGENVAPLHARLVDWLPRFASLPVETTLDAAIAEVSAEALDTLASRRRDWPVGTAWPFGDERFRLRTRGGEIGGGAMESVTVWLALGGDHSRSYLLRNALGWRTDAPTQPGDSGAAVWNPRDELVALHAGSAPPGSGFNAVAVPIGPVLSWVGADLVRRDEALLRPAIVRDAAPAAPLRATVPVAVPGASATEAQLASGEADVLARTMWGEARGEGLLGMEAVGHVVLNRVAAPRWWGRDVDGVCRKGFQFSCWNVTDPNLVELTRVDARNPDFHSALAIAERLLATPPGDRARGDAAITAGATHYYARRLVRPPRWALGRTPCARIGGHDFFKDIG